MNTKKVKTYRLVIKGKVQDVGFRHWFSNLAISLGLNGNFFLVQCGVPLFLFWGIINSCLSNNYDLI